MLTNRQLTNIFFGLIIYSSLSFLFIYNRSTMSILSVNFKVYGIVQGVFFRKYTLNQAKMLELKGWVRNEYDGTVVGIMQGQPNKIEMMKKWLSTEGSPHSRIDYCEFTQEKWLTEPEFQTFEITR
ncbi:Acylphosphatase-1 [Dermatophagoides pteronyssinus]|uniref:Acylphosphatase-1 n=2 Tax=Dermatophagoides pteronyssinus TaxID=6956 RepID=A0ABQ8J749_DERPT|nr:acylphosphatase-2-like isoform X2 [Dermatophagoides pteronyssinus]KAH9418368.1 Acylphosphatase-1 [Dermatophagoides pteronyssinus]